MTGPRPQPHPVDPRRPRPARRSTLLVFAASVAVLTAVVVVPPAVAAVTALDPDTGGMATRVAWADMAWHVAAAGALALCGLVGLLQSLGGPGRRTEVAR